MVKTLQMSTHWGKDVLSKLRLRVGLTQEALCAKMGKSVSWLAKQEAKESFTDAPKMHPSTFLKLASILGVMPAELGGSTVEPQVSIASENEKPAKPRIPGNFTIRRVSGVGATDFGAEFEVDLMNEEGVPGYLYPFPMQDPMVLRVKGASMSYDGRESIEDGDDVIFANALEEMIQDGEVVVARHLIKETQTVKVFHRLPGNMIRLSPLNPAPRYGAIEEPEENLVIRKVKVVVRYRYKSITE